MAYPPKAVKLVRCLGGAGYACAGVGVFLTVFGVLIWTGHPDQDPDAGFEGSQLPTRVLSVSERGEVTSRAARLFFPGLVLLALGIGMRMLVHRMLLQANLTTEVLPDGTEASEKADRDD